MKQATDILVPATATGLSGIMTFFQKVDVVSLVSFLITFLCGVLTIIYTIVKLIKLSKNQKLTPQEVGEATTDVVEAIKEIQDSLSQLQEKGEGKDNDFI